VGEHMFEGCRGSVEPPNMRPMRQGEAAHRAQLALQGAWTARQPLSALSIGLPPRALRSESPALYRPSGCPEEEAET